jgi:hypothetical protein
MKSLNTAVSGESQTLAVLDRIEYTYSVGTQHSVVSRYLLQAIKD